MTKKKKTQRWTIKNIGAKMKKTAKLIHGKVVKEPWFPPHFVRRTFLKFKLDT